MLCSDVSHGVLNEPLSSDEIAQHGAALSFPVRAGDALPWPEHGAVDGTRSSTAVKTV